MAITAEGEMVHIVSYCGPDFDFASHEAGVLSDIGKARVRSAREDPAGRRAPYLVEGLKVEYRDVHPSSKAHTPHAGLIRVRCPPGGRFEGELVEHELGHHWVAERGEAGECLACVWHRDELRDCPRRWFTILCEPRAQ